MKEKNRELIEHALAKRMVPLYGKIRHSRVRTFLRAAITRLEKNAFYSASLRALFKKYYGVDVGAYSYGGCFSPGAFPKNTRIGRYVSIAPGVRAFVANHPSDAVSMHPFFYRKELGIVDKEWIHRGELVLGHDAWIAANAIITPGCSSIGIGAIIGAGAVVTKDVPAYAVVVGNPARVVKYRFNEGQISTLLESKWWECPIDLLATRVELFNHPASNAVLAGLKEKRL
jgi:acetyltransferase-like isoleucine patch superfamily enzyme